MEQGRDGRAPPLLSCWAELSCLAILPPINNAGLIKTSPFFATYVTCDDEKWSLFALSFSLSRSRDLGLILTLILVFRGTAMWGFPSFAICNFSFLCLGTGASMVAFPSARRRHSKGGGLHRATRPMMVVRRGNNTNLSFSG